jgi:hypothetical protein
VQVFDAAHAATAATTDVITSATHKLINGDIIYFTSLTGGVGLSTFTAYYVRDKTASTFKVATTKNGAAVNITDNYSAMSWSRLVYNVKQAASNAEIVNDRFDHIPANLHLKVNTTYRWRARVYDNEGQVSGYTALTSFSVSNTDPNPPTLTPVDGSTYATLDTVLFRGGTFSDPDAGDRLLAYEVQLSAYPEGDAHWDVGRRRVHPLAHRQAVHRGRRYVVGDSVRRQPARHRHLLLARPTVGPARRRQLVGVRQHHPVG